jgi:alanyl-tRNA synthetase
MVLQGVHSTYETDLFVPIIERTMALLGSDDAHYRANFAKYRAVADHSRSVAFLIADGVLPGNTGRSYVLRRILRRAVYQGRSIGLERPFLTQTVEQVIGMMAEAYPELNTRRNVILETVDAEEQQFLRTLTGGMVRLGAVIEQVRAAKSAVIPGEDAFMLKDTYGFPLDLTQKIATEQGLEVDEAGYDVALQEQRERGRRATQFKRGADAEIWGEMGLPATTFVGYDLLADSSNVLAIVVGGDSVAEANQGQQVQIVLNRTPFYAESGGQVGDTGDLYGPHGHVHVNDTQRPVPGVIVHYGIVIAGSIGIGETVATYVDQVRRGHIIRNHTATHLLHRALRDILGEHAAQAGSLVSPERLRFDFAHTRQVMPDQLHEIERRINAWVRADTPVVWAEMAHQEAINAGAMALFGEKYGDRVRMVTVGCDDPQPIAHTATMDVPEVTTTWVMCSRELCGGVHVARTGEIGFFRIVAETSVAAGVRRIEAITGAAAEQWADEQYGTLRSVATKLGVPPAQVVERIDALLADLRQTQQELDGLRSQAARGTLEQLLGNIQKKGDLAYLAARVEADDAARLREMGDWLRDKIGSGVVVIGAVIADKVHLLAMVTPDLAGKRVHAGNLVKALAPIVGGSGGGRPDMAQAGGREPSKLNEALAHVTELL